MSLFPAAAHFGDEQSHTHVMIPIKGGLQLVEGSDDRAAADPSLLRIIARAHDLQISLMNNVLLSVHDIARQQKVTAAYVYTASAPDLAGPDITTAIVNGHQTQGLDAKALMRRASQLPADWAAQHALLGFH